MKKITKFTASEWVKLTPIIHAFKQVRNDIVLSKYITSRSKELTPFLEHYKILEGQNIAVIIAFEQPWALNFLLEQAKLNLRNTHVIVMDNSKNILKRVSIKEVCQVNNIPYISLPTNLTKHVNRSHGMAMSWAYYNVIKALKPNIFSFLDHDLIPLEKINIEEKMGNQPIYGLLNKGIDEYWSLWAGFCSFRFNLVKDANLNFLYDFSRGLDTGGRNWDHIYKMLPAEEITFANRKFEKISSPINQEQREVETLDESWIHMSGISYNNNFESKADFYSAIYKAINSGAKLTNLLSNSAK